MVSVSEARHANKTEVRNKAAESLITVMTSSGVDLTDWSRPPGELRAKVRQIQTTIRSGLERQV